MALTSQKQRKNVTAILYPHSILRTVTGQKIFMGKIPQNDEHAISYQNSSTKLGGGVSWSASTSKLGTRRIAENYEEEKYQLAIKEQTVLCAN